MGILKTILTFIADVVAKLLPTLLKDGKKPKEVKTIGDNKRLREDMNRVMEEKLRGVTDTFVCPACGAERVEDANPQVGWICTECEGLQFMHSKTRGSMRHCKKCKSFVLHLDGTCDDCGEKNEQH